MSKSIFWQGNLKEKRICLENSLWNTQGYTTFFIPYKSKYAFKLVKSSQDKGEPSFCHPPLHSGQWEWEDRKVLGIQWANHSGDPLPVAQFQPLCGGG